MADTEESDRRCWVLAALEQFEGRLTRFAVRLLGDREAAADTVQHAFLRLCEESPQKLEGRLAQWLFTVCRNKAVDFLRLRRQAEHLDGESGHLPGREPDPAVAAQQHDLYGRLRALVGQLPAAQREAVDLWAEGFAFSQIAQITGRTEVNVRVLVHRGLKALRQHPLARELSGHTSDGDGSPRRASGTSPAAAKTASPLRP
jgi:RNA polymerase sigma factor (sigma-70 family)